MESIQAEQSKELPPFGKHGCGLLLEGKRVKVILI